MGGIKYIYFILRNKEMFLNEQDGGIAFPILCCFLEGLKATQSF